MIDRREFIVAIGATGLLAACQSGPPKPSVISVNVTGGSVSGSAVTPLAT